MDPFDVVIITAIGTGLGFITGMTGLLLGPARFPAIATFESSVPASVGTTLGTGAMTAIAASVNYYAQGNIHRKILLTLSATAAVGCFLGAFLTNLLPSLGIMIMMVIVMGYSIFAMLRSRKVEPIPGHAVLSNRQYAKEGIIGFGIGLFGGVIGTILMAIRLPVFIKTFRMEPKVAIGTCLAASGIVGMCGFVAQFSQDNIHFLIFVIMGASGMIGGVMGSRVTDSMNPKLIKKILIVVMLAIAAYLSILIIIEILQPATIVCNSCF